MDYSQLSDFEINKLVANATGTQVEETYQFVNGGEDIADHMSGIVLLRKITSNWKHWKIYDPCNSPSDAWPIITKNRISIEFDGDNSTEPQTTWCHTANLNRTCGTNYQKNPLRAAMITFLLMQEQVNA
ncbi:DUF2591 domain-containing protein [Salmonella enterica]|uniref:phage protein NinX family protein n=1 Tax=Citrobacter sedlakii TaxID=67826 RepID=UPI00107D865C|nr:DUF2591 domain-containing protein [Salmonella enterica]EAO1878834.1 DUF2591 domain-containing protein [Salmonella enterica subsp. enterica serovar Worthington]EBV8195919.1 DUF2591 domain-containing protein [Salmonella enterica subsp. enterica serovar Derby]ECS2870169.1 DUF2591 domain-containing protein [Salmonella enterica subsp. enterica serovar Farmsen]EEE0318747.1 DUF2591 domain-containing protein [Salmonella enterica subsp. enterica serovar Putten]